jgi:hypothetical protein
MWCRRCGALLGVRDPIADWSADQNGLCLDCAEEANDQQTGEEEVTDVKKENAEAQEARSADAAEELGGDVSGP